ncbi:MAG TPA: HD domain-containing phosphohydrolase [Terriglobales bacterium]|nr:HD domain-containing phosphohydrolase [Terriglobales bacterium]
MATTVPSKPSPASTGVRALPLVVFFEQDAGQRYIAPLNRFRKVSFSALADHPQDVEHILICTNEDELARHYEVLRRPYTRVIAIAKERFADARIDGAIYAYLPPSTPPELIERMIDNAIDHVRLLANRREVNERLANMQHEIAELNEIGAALSAEHDTSKLLELILTKARMITQSDAGSLYLVEALQHETDSDRPEVDSATVGELNLDGTASKIVRQVEGPKQLRFKLAQNDSKTIPFKEATMEINDKSIAGYVALTGKPVRIDDAYRLNPEVPYTINRKFDEDSGYRTKSILAVPMRNQKEEIVGVVQLINAKKQFGAKLENLSAVTQQVISYTERQQQVVESLASQAAVALENSRLYEAIQRLFEGFVRASVIAIEARDPTTSGHSFRVANLTVALAEVVDRCETGPFANLRFSRNEMKEIRYASLLHDFGKVGVREEVLIKARKLYPAQLDLIKQRFQFVKRSMQAESLEKQLNYVLEKSRDEYLKKSPQFKAELKEQMEELDIHLMTVLGSNEPTVLPEGSFEKLADIAANHFFDMDGEDQALLTEDEVRLLSIRKGSLDEAERLQIESHVVHTFKFLQQIPWTKEIKNIPAIARGHHEKLNGLGYPFKLSAPEIPIQTRMMTISDIFDALSASDRPYKKAVSLERAIDILGFAVKDGEVDGQLFELFREAQVWQRWKVEPYPY